MKVIHRTFAAAFVIGTSVGVAQAATVSGAQCGNKYIGLTQNDIELTATMCSSGNSTGGKNSPIGQSGWTDSAEYNGSTTNTGDVTMSINASDNYWSLLNPLGYTMLGISVKQGNGYAFYILDAAEPLFGEWFTGDNTNPTGSDVSHINAWYKGDPAVPPVPLPAAGLMLLAAIGGLFGARRRKVI